MNGCVVIPTFNESKIIYKLVSGIKKFGLDVLVIDDGSRDGTAELARNVGAIIISHSRNMGKGVSLRDGFKKVVNENYDFIITMDGDGQHSPDDIENFIRTFSEQNSDIIVGNRMDDSKNMPFIRWITNRAMSMIISSICKTYIPDTQCGFRLIKTSVLRDMVLSTSNYEIESELLIQASKKNYRIKSIPIVTIYEGQVSQINPLVDTIRFFRFILKDRIKEMWFILKEFFNDTIIKHGSIMFFASIFGNIFNLVFWLFMVRKLDYIEYGILNSIVSFLTVTSLPIVILQTALVRFFSEFKAQEKKENTQALFRAFFKRILLINIVGLVIFFVFSENITDFLHLNSRVFVYLTACSIFFSSLLILTMGALQGLQLFNRIALNAFFQSFTKLFSGMILVLIGLKAVGAFWGFIFSGFSSFILSLFQLPSWVMKMKKEEYIDYKPQIKLKEIYVYFLPVTVALISYSLFTNSDMILVKHFFNETDVGIYSIAQTVGKIILFLPGAITVVFFPLAVQQGIQNRNMAPLLKRSLIFVAFLCLLGSVVVLTLPKLVLRIISGKVYSECIPLVRFIIFPMSLFALNFIFIFYNLSKNNLRFIFYIFVISILQIILILNFHKTLFDVIGVLFVSSLLVFYLGLRSIKEKDRK